jgi:hypothetical protein
MQGWRFVNGYAEATELSPDEANTALRIVTVLALLVTAVFLGIFGLLSDAVITFLSAVAGFVLGGLSWSQKNAGTPEEKK